MSKIAQAIILIKHFEGLKQEHYICPGGYKTIGYGHILEDQTIEYFNGDEENEIMFVCTKEQAEIYLYQDISDVLFRMFNLIELELSDNELNALISFTYNVGIGNFKRSTLLKKINNNDIPGASGQFERWVYSKGKILDGLVRRRAAEKELFDK